MVVWLPQTLLLSCCGMIKEVCPTRLSSIKIPHHYLASYPLEHKLEACRQYYHEHNALDRDLIVSADHTLVDGYIGFLVLLENNVEEYPVVCTEVPDRTYIAARHPGNNKVYFWRVTPRTKDALMLLPGLWAEVNTKYGHEIVQIVDVFSAAKPPAHHRMRSVYRALPNYLYQSEGVAC